MDATGINGGLDARPLPKDPDEKWSQGRDYFGTTSGTHYQANFSRGAFRDNHRTHRGHGTGGGGYTIYIANIWQIKVVLNLFHGEIGHGVIKDHSSTFSRPSTTETIREIY